jgi:hypothetical protein
MIASNMIRDEYDRVMLGMEPLELDDVIGAAVVPHEVDPNPVNATGTVGQCWTNAQIYCRRDPGRYQYVEGMVRRAPGAPWEAHGYVFDRQAGHVIETTTGYAEAVEYRGVELDLDAVDRWFAEHPDEGYADDPEDGRRPSVIWLMIWLCLEQCEPLDIRWIASRHSMS